MKTPVYKLGVICADPNALRPIISITHHMQQLYCVLSGIEWDKEWAVCEERSLCIYNKRKTFFIAAIGPICLWVTSQLTPLLGLLWIMHLSLNAIAVIEYTHTNSSLNKSSLVWITCCLFRMLTSSKSWCYRWFSHLYFEQSSVKMRQLIYSMRNKMARRWSR